VGELNGYLNVTDIDSIAIASDTSVFTSQLRRRDLNVVPAVNPFGQIGLTCYSGVFTCEDAPLCNKSYPDPTAAYLNLDNDGVATVEIDQNVNQYSNIYATYNIQVYSPSDQTMFSNMLGGMGGTDEATSKQAPFSNLNSTLIRTWNQDQSSSSTQYIWEDTLPGNYGSEGQFMNTSSGLGYAGDDEIFDLNSFTVGSTTLIGYCYGGIHAVSGSGNPKTNTSASNAVFKIELTRIR